MVCTNCGAHLMETDQFCPKCGTKAIREKRCPDCGTVLREGTRFCHKCGRQLDGAGSVHKVSDETIDIPIAAIEENILSETAAEIRAERRTSTSEKRAVRSASERVASARDMSSRSASARSAAPGKRPAQQEPRRKAADPMPPQKKRKVYRDDDWDDDNWEDDEDWEDDDWDDEEGVDVITVMTAVIGCVLLVVVAVLGFNLYKQHVPKNYDRIAENGQETEQEEGQEQSVEPSQELGEMESVDAEGGGETYKLTVIHNVNVRDNPSTSGTNVLKVAQEGETYTCYGTAGDGEWYQILLEDGSTGYVFQDYVVIE